MNHDWQTWRVRHPRLCAFIVLTKRLRTKTGLFLALLLLLESIYHREIPLDLDQPGLSVCIALALILTGIGIRIAGYGCLRKKETLATTGVYSVCRHPLYLGTMLATFGFGILINDPKAYSVAIAYFGIFYTPTILWEEIRCAQRFGEAHRRYVAATPLLFPLGRFRPGAFSWGQAARNGGAGLMFTAVLLLAVIEVMAETLPWASP